MTNSPSEKKPNVRIVTCPECGKKAEFSPLNPFRPFCSERCRLTDLGTWAQEKYRVPTEEKVDFEISEDEKN